jgi:hypothetical protein
MQKQDKRVEIGIDRRRTSLFLVKAEKSFLSTGQASSGSP